MKFYLPLPFHDDPVPVVLDFSLPPTEEEQAARDLYVLDQQLNRFRGNHHSPAYRGLLADATAYYDELVADGLIEEWKGA